MKRIPATLFLAAAATVLGLLFASTPASANHPYSRARIGDAAGQTWATANSTNNLVTMRPFTSTSRQVWAFSDASVGVRVRNLANGRCLSVPRTWSGTNPPVHHLACVGHPNEQWQLVATSSTTWAFRNVGVQGRCMAIHRSYSPPRLFVVPCNFGASNQQFRLRRY
ncbi:MAG: RICIN domain-containing protein [Micromonosporaceae bacterium]